MTAGVAQRGLSIVALTTLLTGCMVGPDYRRPLTAPPAQYRFALGDVRDPASIADIAWVDLFQDDALRELIRTALVQNYDVQIAAARILQARAQVGIVRSEMFPTISGGGSLQKDRLAQNDTGGLPPGANSELSFGMLSFNMTWEVDVWGRIRRLTESARAESFASEEIRRAVLTPTSAPRTFGSAPSTSSSRFPATPFRLASRACSSPGRSETSGRPPGSM